MQEFLHLALFQVAGQDFTIGQLILTIGMITLIWYLYRVILRRYFPKVFASTEIDNSEKLRLGHLFRWLVIGVVILTLINILKIDQTIYQANNFVLSILDISKAFIFIQIARLLDWSFSNLFVHNFLSRREEQTQVYQADSGDTETSARRMVQQIFYTIIAIYILRSFNWNLTLFQKTINDHIVSIKLTNILFAILIVLIARLFVWAITQIFLYKIYRTRNMDVGARFAINQLVKYVIYVFAFIWALTALGFNLNILFGAAAALLVGVGLGLQQTFNDFISGIVLLFERSVAAGDILEVDGELGRVQVIGLRSSILETRGGKKLVVPNHKLVNEKVINWNHQDDIVRFEILVSVAYGSDTTLVKKCLLQAIEKHPSVLGYPEPFVRFLNFGESALEFGLYIYSTKLMDYQDTMSDVRLEIDKIFRANQIEIPFPQREVRLINPRK